MATPFIFVEDTTQLTFTNLNKLTDMGAQNWLRNPSFEDWTTAISPAVAQPDGWTWTDGTSGTLSEETTTIKHGLSSAKIVKSAVGSLTKLEQTTTAGTYAQGLTFTFGAWVWCNTASRMNVRISDGVGTTDSAAHTGSSSWEWLAVTRTCDGSATELTCGVEITSGGGEVTGYIDGAMLVGGEVDIPFAPSVGAEFVFNPYDDTLLDQSGAKVSTTAYTAIDVPSVTSGWCDDGTIAVLLRVAVTDTAFRKQFAWGAASVSDGDTIAHGLPTTPTAAFLTSSDASHNAAVEGLDGTNITVGLHDMGDSPVTTPNETVYWHAYLTTAQDSYLNLRKKDETDADKIMFLRPMNDSATYWIERQVWVALDSGGEFEWSVTTPGTSTFAAIIRAFGYLRPV
jgi:hypothetical protein